MRASALIASLTLSSACNTVLSEDEAPDSDIEFDVDAGNATDAADQVALPCEFSSYLNELCDIDAPSPAPTFEAVVYDLDTDTGTLSSALGSAVQLELADRQLGSTDVAIWYVDAFAIPATTTLRASGTRALVIVSQSTIAIAGTLDVSSDGPSEPRRGAGSNSACEAADGTPDLSTSGGGSGGGGGAFQGAGGHGGIGNDDGGQNEQSGGLGAPAHPTIPVAPRSGCDGGDGGYGVAPTRAAGGAAGGSLLLIARASIDATSESLLDASGAGGDGGAIDPDGGEGGGGGGGSGGYIGIEAPRGSLDGIIIANGGGGGGGGTNFGPGAPGRDGDSTAETGQGGAPNGFATSGGDGGSVLRSDLDGANVTGSTSAGGGGGGGGAGWIVIAGDVGMSGQVSPLPARL